MFEGKCELRAWGEGEEECMYACVHPHITENGRATLQYVCGHFKAEMRVERVP
jgi:hypothetical protein